MVLDRLRLDGRVAFVTGGDAVLDLTDSAASFWQMVAIAAGNPFGTGCAPICISGRPFR